MKRLTFVACVLGALMVAPHGVSAEIGTPPGLELRDEIIHAMRVRKGGEDISWNDIAKANMTLGYVAGFRNGALISQAATCQGELAEPPTDINNILESIVEWINKHPGSVVQDRAVIMWFATGSDKVCRPVSTAE